MKNNLITLCFLFCLKLSFAQNKEFLGKTFIITQNYSAQTCDAIGKNTAAPNAPLERNFKVVVTALVDKEGYVIEVPRFTVSERILELNENFYGVFKDVSETKGNVTKMVRKLESRIYFLIPLQDFERVAEPEIPKFAFTLGIPTVPVKLRFGNGGTGKSPRYFNFEGNLSLGLSAGMKYSLGPKRQYGIMPLLGFTIGSVAVDSVSTQGRVNTKTTNSSFSPHFGLVFDVNDFELGLFTGFDFLNGEPNSFWVYRNQLWLGVGVGYSLFNTERVKEPKN